MSEPRTNIGKFRKQTSGDGRKDLETDILREVKIAVEEASEDVEEY